MNRLPLQFECEGSRLAGTLDTAPGTRGLLIVTGGNEIRSGAFSGQSRLAARIAKAGFPVFRYDRRGIGDSEGDNSGYRGSTADILAAADAFRAIAPQLSQVVAFGNCDAASALMLAEGAGCDGLVLSNPWTIEEGADDHTPPPDAVRARYVQKLKNPREVARLLRGGVDLRKLARGIGQAMRPAATPSSLAEEMRVGISSFGGRISILLATADRTAQVFESGWDKADPRIARCEGAGHSYAEPQAQAWLDARLLEALRAA